MRKARLFVRAFTLVELSISIAVISLLTVILLGQYPETAVRLTLTNVAHKVSLLAREAQVRGSAVDSANKSLGGYGIYVSLASPGQVLLIGDLVETTSQYNEITVGNGLYDFTPVDEAKSLALFPSGYTISKLCVGTGFPFTCNTANTPSITSLAISFVRPDPRAVIYVNNTAGTPASAACIELRSPRAPLSGHIRSVQVYNSGRIVNVLGKCNNDPS